VYLFQVSRTRTKYIAHWTCTREAITAVKSCHLGLLSTNAFCASMPTSKKQSTNEGTRSIAFAGIIATKTSVNIYFYLEDDSVHVSEPKTPNSGIPQGTLIRRHRIPKAESATGQHFTVTDFNVGQQVTFYSRTFKIMGCDDFTRVQTFDDRISSVASTSVSRPTLSSPTTHTRFDDRKCSQE
jgi:DUF1126 PH-like domain